MQFQHLFDPCKDFGAGFRFVGYLREDAKKSVDIYFGLSVVDYETRLTDTQEVTKFIGRKLRNEDYKDVLIFYPSCYH